MRWTAALLLALALHVTSWGIIWLYARGRSDPARARLERAVEVVIAEPVPVPPPDGVPPVFRSAFRSALAGADRDRAAERARAAAGKHKHVSEAEPARTPDRAGVPAGAPPAPAPSPEPPPRLATKPPASVAFAGPRSTLDLRAAAPAPGAPAPAGAPPAGVDLTLHGEAAAMVTGTAPAVRGGQVIDEPGVRGEIGRDGTMRIHGKSAVSLGSDLTSPGATLKNWLKDPKAHAAERDGTVALISGKFDATDSLMRAFGQDPYRAQRAKMLDATREQRLTLAARDRTARQGQELAALPATLRNIWNDATRPVTERRRIIFQLWDECQEAAEGEAESTAAGTRARRTIVLFIRAQVSAQSGNAYPKEELALLNQMRQSRQRFDPYGSSMP